MSDEKRINLTERVLRSGSNGVELGDIVNGRFVRHGAPESKPEQPPAPEAKPETTPDESAALRQKLEVAERELAAARLDARIQQAFNRALR